MGYVKCRIIINWLIKHLLYELDLFICTLIKSIAMVYSAHRGYGQNSMFILGLKDLPCVLLALQLVSLSGTNNIRPLDRQYKPVSFAKQLDNVTQDVTF